MSIRRTTTDDIQSIFKLYKATASIPGGLARTADEITMAYISTFISRSLDRGLALVIERNGMIVGEIHAYSPGIEVFKHMLSDLTICIHPDHQGLKLGRKIFQAFMAIVDTELVQIQRVELIARESNSKAIHFYESLGFKIEGRLTSRINGIAGKMEDDIPMGWLRQRREHL